MVGGVGNCRRLTLPSRVKCHAIALVLAVVGSGCTAGNGVDQRVTLEVRDGWIREPGSECAGSRPFLYVHEGAPFRVERGSSGEVVAEGTLPTGTAVEAVREDLGVRRVPTFCRFRFTVSLPSGDHRLVLDEGSPLEFTTDGEPSDVTLLIP